MSSRYEILAALREIGGKSLLQEEPYPVLAPRTVELAAQIFQTARESEHKILIIGSGSSFPPNFSVLRDNVVAVMTVGLMGIEHLTPFCARILSGTPSAHVFKGESIEKRTLGGLVCDAATKSGDGLRQSFWTRIRAVEVLTATGEVQRFAGAAQATLDDPALANLFVGSAGRLGMITAFEVATPLPILSETARDQRMAFEGGAGDAAISAKDAQLLLDPNGLFQW
jgi:FAD/FMN-containing dehydrogenase